ncbi:DUF6624 domain-containing protein [Simiduia agarivorans]|uniref:Uncharacterized protein n=1 Tax=Simiduia agarivorans (strain DSM 21679 / JCM 13881 / BCRC 17597 / SA1) TaxID=1117647 RepID=K4KKZ7_SIMAS|nr:DUF6624 domain-containing protein [Simiduia agarivorans]AFU99671.1 hypothetical protein M5M_12575 [Simiduia agarivorans SA1 = DSM 21679]
MCRTVFILIQIFIFSIQAHANSDYWEVRAKDVFLHDKSALNIKSDIEKAYTLIETFRSRASESLPFAWQTTEFSPIMCLDANAVRQQISELELISRSDSYEQYIINRHIAKTVLSNLDSYLRDYRKEVIHELGTFSHAEELADIVAGDQGTILYFYVEHSKEFTSSSAVRQYLEYHLTQRRCEAVLAATPFFEQYLAERGWPVWSKYEKSIGEYFFTVLQHFSNRPDLMKKVQAALEQWSKNGEAEDWYYPDITDKILIQEGKPQKYGTFIRCIDGAYKAVSGVSSRANLDQIRAEYGLRPFEEELALREQKLGSCAR